MQKGKKEGKETRRATIGRERRSLVNRENDKSSKGGKEREREREISLVVTSPQGDGCVFLRFFVFCDSGGASSLHPLPRWRLASSDAIRENPLTMEISQFPRVTPF